MSLDGAPRAPDPRVAVVGAGAVGGYYAGLLAAAGVPVTVIGRAAQVAAIRTDGLRIERAAGELVVHVAAATDPGAVAGCDVVLVCVKSRDTASVAAALAPHLQPGAVVYSLQNGVDNVEALRAALRAPVRPAVVYVASEQVGPGRVRHLGRGELVLPADADAPLVGSGDGAPRPNADVAAMFRRAGVPVSISSDVESALWSKLALNCTYNALSALTGLPYAALVRQPGLREVMHAAVAECAAVAHACGITLEPDIDAAVERIADTMPAQVSSTAQDLRRHRPTEIDHLNGAVVRHGARAGIATPVNRTLHALVKALEAGDSLRSPVNGSRAAAGPADRP